MNRIYIIKTKPLCSFNLFKDHFAAPDFNAGAMEVSCFNLDKLII